VTVLDQEVAEALDQPAGLPKIHPKLRMFANGDTEVNVLRAEHACSLAVVTELAESVPPLRAQDAAPAMVSEPPPKGKLEEAERPDAFVSVFVHFAVEDLNDHAPQPAAPPLTASKKGIATAELSVAEAFELAQSDKVSFVEPGQPLTMPRPMITADSVAAPSEELRRFGDAAQHGDGADVLIGVIDVGGFDFAHPDFIVDGKTRFLSIWDQGGNARPSPAEHPDPEKGIPFAYGSELLADDLNAAIEAASEPGQLPATVLEPQSETEIGSHGTHVASIVAGNGGICRKAQIAAVLISIPKDDLERRKSFYDSTRLAHAVDYLLAVAAREGKPIAINVSLGTNGHAHDDSSPVARWIDASLSEPGRCICVAAGNAGQERPERDGDIGFVMGRVHASGQIRARELVADIEWNVVGNGLADVSENELEIWYGPADRFSVQVKPPGEPWSEKVQPGEFIENRQLSDGSFMSVYNELYHPANGSNLIGVYLSPDLSRPIVGVRAGVWLVRLIGEEVRDGRYHAWIERDDPRRIGRIGGVDAWVFPSFFAEQSFVDQSTISSLACGPRIIAVANFDSERRQISITSSQGPTRDEREKPDIAAPGTNIVAAKGFSPGDDWIEMSGTSMASPYVTGIAGLMLAVNPKLTAAQIGGIFKRTARPLPGSDFSWRDDAGAGEIDPGRCLEEAATVAQRKDLT
jgi:subtilisin family serine protease